MKVFKGNFSSVITRRSGRQSRRIVQRTDRSREDVADAEKSRKNKCKQEIIPLDLNKAETILSPYYYLQQNDIIYVTPNKAKARNSDVGNSTSLWFSATSILVSIASLLFNILK